MQQRLEQLNKKIIVGGENLLEKAEAQERLLQESAAELEDAKKKEEEIRKELEEKEAVRLDIEDKYTNLQVKNWVWGRMVGEQLKCKKASSHTALYALFFSWKSIAA